MDIGLTAQGDSMTLFLDFSQKIIFCWVCCFSYEVAEKVGRRAVSLGLLVAILWLSGESQPEAEGQRRKAGLRHGSLQNREQAAFLG